MLYTSKLLVIYEDESKRKNEFDTETEKIWR